MMGASMGTFHARVRKCDPCKALEDEGLYCTYHHGYRDAMRDLVWVMTHDLESAGE